MNVKAVNGTTKTTTARTAEDAPAAPITGNRPMRATIKIPVDRLPDAPEPTLPYREPENLGIGAWIDHDYRVRLAEKRKNERKGK